MHPDAPLREGVVRAADRFWGTPGAFEYGACPECGTWVLCPRPSPDEMGPHYAPYYGPEELTMRRELWAEKPPRAALGVDFLRAEDALARLRRLGAEVTSESRVLDAGSGPGGFLVALRELVGARARGVDFSPVCAEFGAEVYGTEIDTGELAAQGYPEESFDVVTSWHCLEHTYDPLAELMELRRITRAGGWLLVEVPTVSLVGRLLRGRWLFLQAPTHLFHFRPAALRALVERAGWEVRELRRPWAPTELAGSLLLALGFSGFAPRLMFARHKPWKDRLAVALFLALMVVDLPVTLLASLLGGSGVLRLTARRAS